MPFGLCNATATFQRLMAQALTNVTKNYGNLIMCYVDDVKIAKRNAGGPYRETRRGHCLHETGRPDRQTFQVRNPERLNQVSGPSRR